MTVTVSHIVLDDKGIARIASSRIRVVDIVMNKMANGWTPEEIQQQYPHLSVAQVYAAFVYYYEHQAELDAAIDREHREAIAARAAQGEAPARKRLREIGKLP